MIKIFPDIEELNNFAAEKFVEISRQAIEKRGRFTVALAGGSTPKSFYQLLTSDEFKNQTDWKRCFFFFGDERNVLPTDAESNFRMADENLFAPLKIAETNILRWQTEIVKPFEIAENYEKSITDFFKTRENVFPNFDLILLGVGADGHTASLFPFTKALLETEKIAAANWVEKLNTWRYTLTFPALNNAENVIFLVAGENKAGVLQKIFTGEFDFEELPAQNIKPANGNLYWLVDEQAARFLES